MKGLARRDALRAVAVVPALCLTTRVAADEYAGASEVFAAIDLREAEVATRLRALARALPTAAALADSLLRDHERFRGERAKLRSQLRLAPALAAFPAPAGVEPDLQGLRDAIDRLVYAHAEGLPALRDDRAVRRLATHMVELARHLTVVDLWQERERG